VNDALTQPGEKLRAINRLGAIGFGIRVTVVDKHQVQIRAVSQLDSAHLAVANNNKAGVAQAAVRALGRSVLGHRLAPGQRQHLLQNRLGQPGQVIADFH